MQVLFQAEDNARGRNMRYAAVLHLDKYYDKVDRRILILLRVASQWLDEKPLKMVRTLLGPLHIHSKWDPINYEATVTTGVPQGASS